MGGETKILKCRGGGQAGSRGGCVKKRGLEPPYKLWFNNLFYQEKVARMFGSASAGSLPICFLLSILSNEQFL